MTVGLQMIPCLNQNGDNHYFALMLK